jgi:esterase/lipase superfamily enzyme
MNREYHKWYSNRLQRDMELLIFGHGGRAVLFFPTRMARFYDYENWGIVDALREPIERGELQLFCVDSIDAESLYNQAVFPSTRISRHMQYEQYLLNEVVPLMRLKNSNGFFEVAGCSMGAFHAANFGIKHASIFKKIVCMSGRFDLTKGIYDFRDLFDGYRDENVYLNTPLQYVANGYHNYDLNAVRNTEIILAIGETDPFLVDNQAFSQLLWNKGISNQFYIWNGYAHRPRYWRQMVALYL